MHICVTRTASHNGMHKSLKHQCTTDTVFPSFARHAETFAFTLFLLRREYCINNDSWMGRTLSSEGAAPYTVSGGMSQPFGKRERRETRQITSPNVHDGEHFLSGIWGVGLFRNPMHDAKTQAPRMFEGTAL